MNAQTVDVLVRVAGALASAYQAVLAAARDVGADDETLARLAALWQAGADELRQPVPDATGQP